MTDENLPVIAGVGQITQRPETERPKEPLALMADAARQAEADAGVPELLQSLDSIRVVNVISWPSKAPAQDLARALAVAPREQMYTHIGGNTPQWLVNDAAERVHAGALKLVLIAGAESVYSARRARTQSVDLGWSARGTPAPDAGDGRPGMNQQEIAHGATLPVRVYPLFENALRAHYGRSLTEHQRSLGELSGSLSAVAAANPHSWFREARSPGEIATPGASNRYIGFPYTKYMNAILDVDMGAALIVTSAGEAQRLGVPEDRLVYLWGCGDATDHWLVTERLNYYSSPAIRAAGASALSMAGVGIDDVSLFDLYSCFPSAVQITRDMLGIPEGDARPLTVTGGLPYFGGPGNNYSTHAIATMAERLRERPGAIGMVTANGWYVTKHSVGIYGNQPPRGPWLRADPRADQARIDAQPRPDTVAEPAGPATVETYTVLFDREGSPERAIVIGRDAEDRRFIANTPDDRRLLEAMCVDEAVGSSGLVRQLEGRNVFEAS